MREGAEYFTSPASAAQRRYEALRAYFLDGMPAAEVADRFGYFTASVHQMATLLRKGRLALFAETSTQLSDRESRLTGDSVAASHRARPLPHLQCEADHGAIQTEGGGIDW